MLGKLTVAGLPGLRSELAFLRGEMVAGPDGSCVVFALVRVPAMGSTGSGTDLDAAIDVSRKAVAATPLDHHPARAACSSGLAHASSFEPGHNMTSPTVPAAAG